MRLREGLLFIFTVSFIFLSSISEKAYPVSATKYSRSPSEVVDTLINIKINTDGTFEIQNEEQIAINPTNPDNLVAVWRDFRLGYRQVGRGVSTDGGQTWTDELFVETPYPWDSDPGITYDRFGNFYVVILSFDPNAPTSSVVVSKSTDGGQTFGQAIKVIDSAGFEDKELLACDRTGGPYDGNLYVSWTHFNGSTPPIQFSHSTDGGVNWSAPQTISQNSSQVQWSVPAVGANGEVYVAWDNFSPRSIRFTKSTDGGVTFTPEKTLFSTGFYTTTLNGGILTFSFPAIDCDISDSPYRGNIYLVWADRKDSETDTDIYFSRSSDGGNTWDAPKRVNDDPVGNGKDQFHPWVSVNQDGVITIIFYDRREDVFNYAFDLFMTHSFDGGLSFTPNQKVTTAPSFPIGLEIQGIAQVDENYRKKALAGEIPLSILSPMAGLIGEYTGLVTWGKNVHTVWTDIREENQDVYTAPLLEIGLFPPKLLSPVDSVTIFDNTPLFEWYNFSIYSTVTHYSLQIDKKSNFTSAITIIGIDTTFYVLPDSLALQDSTYYWRVKAFEISGDSSTYSGSSIFRVLSYLLGDVTRDMRISPSDLVYLINYLFKNGPAPVPLQSGDVNCDTSISPADLIIIINFLFKRGPQPNCS